MAYKLTHLALLVFTLITATFPYNIKANALPPADIFISSAALMQADTLLVRVKNEPGAVTGNLGNVPLRFFRSEDQKDWLALVGMPVNKKPGNYKLKVKVQNKMPFQKSISVSKRDFPKTAMVITPELVQKGYTAKKIITNIANKENTLLRLTMAPISKKTYVTKPFIYPLAQINVTGPFGDIRASKNYKIQHLGVDLRAPVGTPVFAANNGKVALATSFPNYGNTIIIDHGLGVYSLYLHLSEFNVAPGHMVAQGDTIGLAGGSGYATGPHLHFSIKVRGAALDPLAFIKTTQTGW